MARSKTFWLVMRGCHAKKRHESLESATKEAERLAAANPGFPYYVLEAVDARYVPAPKKPSAPPVKTAVESQPATA